MACGLLSCACRAMRRELVTACLLLAGCDLKELSEGQGDTPADPDASVPVPEADAADVPDPFDATPPSDAGFGTCKPERWVASASASHPTHPPSHGIDGLLPSRWS